MRIKRVTTRYYDITCPFDRRFGTFGEFEEHRKKRGSMKACLNKCFVCEKKFKTKDSIYIAEVKGSSGNRFVCKECNEKVRESDKEAQDENG